MNVQADRLLFWTETDILEIIEKQWKGNFYAGIEKFI